MSLSLVDEIKVALTAQKAVAQIQSGPKASYLTGEFWAKIATAVCTLWAGLKGFIPHPIDIYITVGLSLVISAERIYLKNKHLDTITDLSQAPPFDPGQLTQALTALISKFPQLAPLEAAAGDAAKTLAKQGQEAADSPSTGGQKEPAASTVSS